MGYKTRRRKPLSPYCPATVQAHQPVATWQACSCNDGCLGLVEQHLLVTCRTHQLRQLQLRSCDLNLAALHCSSSGCNGACNFCSADCCCICLGSFHLHTRQQERTVSGRPIQAGVTCQQSTGLDGARLQLSSAPLQKAENCTACSTGRAGQRSCGYLCVCLRHLLLLLLGKALCSHGVLQ